MNPERLKNIEVMGPASPETLIRPEEVRLFNEYATDEGNKKALAIARFLDFPHTNVEMEQVSTARKRQAAWNEKQKSERRQRPELGAFEYHTASVVAREFEKLLKQGEKVGVIGDVVINIIDQGERRFIAPTEYRERLKEGTEQLRVIGVIISIKGDDQEGANILIRNDMDALQMASNEIKHQCGHNVHSGWAVMNVEGFLKYKERFGTFPFRQVVFVNESNEEANPAAGDQVSPNEILATGFKKKYGEMDFILGAHVIASIPERTVRIEEGGFHGVADFIFEAQPTSNYDLEHDFDISLLPPLLAEKIAEKYGADKPLDNFGHRQLVEDDGTIVPNTYIRLTAAKETASKDANGEWHYENLALNSLTGELTYNGKIGFSLSKDEIDRIVEQAIRPWKEKSFNIATETKIDADGEFYVKITTDGPGHVAYGGPNPQQIMGEIISHLTTMGKILPSNRISKGVKFGGTLRIKSQNHEQIKIEASEALQEMFRAVLRDLNLMGKVDMKFTSQSSVAPVMNDTKMVAEARSVAKAEGMTLSRIRLPNAAAESFAEYQKFLRDDEKSHMLYVLIGGMKQETATKLLETGTPAPLHCVHHSKDFVVQGSAMSQGIILDALAIHFSRQYTNNKKRHNP